ncbi:ATM interactor-like [Arapaima gigas]
MAASAPGTAGAPQPRRSRDSAVCQRPSQAREMVTPSVSELTRVRTNLLCTVEGCAKVLSNAPALNMHLVKSHGLKDGHVNPTLGKGVTGSQKVYCCPVEDCPRGPGRPFARFSSVKQHFMKMHSERKHRCTKCDNRYSTKGDLRRHAEDCGRVYCCGCGCPYASRAALLSHNHRTGHEVPAEHRFPPVRKRRMEGSLSASHAGPNKQNDSMQHFSEEADSWDGLRTFSLEKRTEASGSTKNLRKLLLPKPKVVLMNVPVIQFAQVPVLLTLVENTIPRSKVFGTNHRGSSVSAVQLLPQSTGPVPSVLGVSPADAEDAISLTWSGLDSVSSGWQVSGESADSRSSFTGDLGQRSKGDSVQTGAFVVSKCAQRASSSALLLSSLSQTDISICTQVLLPVNAETQTFSSGSKMTRSTGVQTGARCHLHLSASSMSREAQTDVTLGVSEGEKERGGSIELSDKDFFNVSTQQSLAESVLEAVPVEDPLNSSESTEMIGSGPQNGVIHQNPLAASQTQTMTVFADLESILCEKVAGSASDAPEQSTTIDFDIEDFFNSTNIQTQTDDEEPNPMALHVPLESLDMDTQTSCLFLDSPLHTLGSKTRSDDFEPEMFNTQTQTDLNFLMGVNNQVNVASFLRQTGFSVSTESFDSETQTDIGLSLQCSAHENQAE